MPSTAVAEPTAAPAAAELQDAAEIRRVLGDAVLHAIRASDPRAYFERLARTEPNLFFKYVALLCGQPVSKRDAPNQVLNVIAALPKSPLDELPKGFRLS